VLDLGRVLPGRRLESVVEAVVRNGLASYAAIHRRLSERMGSGFDGCRALRELLEERGLGSRPTGSELELAFEKLVERYGLPKPVRQYPVRHHGKAYRIDEAFPEARIAVELDGYRDHSRKPPFVQDRRKQNVLVLLDWLPLRFTYDDVHLQPAETARTLRTAYQQRTHPPDA
jgi:very-short-patch-repair endonuclease